MFGELPTAIRTVARTGLIRPLNPVRLVAAGQALRHWGASVAGGFASAAALEPDRPCVVDERGVLTWSEVDRRSNAVANALARRGVTDGSVVAVLARNHRGFVEITAALAKLGARTLYLNTGFAGPQLREVTQREGAVAVVHDEEFTELVADGATVEATYVSWADDLRPRPDRRTLEDLVAEGPDTPPPSPAHTGRTIILTSGTTGTPKGADRAQHTGLGSAVSMLDRIPYRAGETVVLAAPMFHSWGFANLTMGLPLASTFVVRRRFDPEATLADVARHHAQVLVAVPVMLQRILELPVEVRRRYDTSSLRLVPLSGSAIPAGLATRWMDEFGDNLYNLYGSTEVGWVSIATPEDLRADPGTAGRPPLYTTVRLLDEDGREVPRGRTGRIFVGSELLFEGYTGGGNKEVVDGLMSTGDTGRMDAYGRLRVDGRDDEMIVSGGENVFPREVEDLIAEHPDVVEVAVVGVEDEEFGQRLKAVVVVRDGARLKANDVKRHVKEHLASFKVPRDVHFMDELPRNATGKILKRELR
jgi:fatty-acyl-CoA synthase